MTERIKHEQNVEALGPFKKGGLAVIRDDVEAELLNRLPPNFAPGEKYRVYGVQGKDNAVWLGPKDAPEEDIEQFHPEKAYGEMSEERYRHVYLFSYESLMALH